MADIPEVVKKYRLDRQGGAVVLEIGDDGRELRLLPTMAAAEEVETALNRGINVEHARLVAACSPFAERVLNDPSTVPTTAELAVILAAGARAGGEPITVTDAKALIWRTGVNRVVLGLLEFVNACANGGRLREEDLGNVASPNGSRVEPNGEDKDAAEELTSELEAGIHSDAGSA